MSVEANDFRNLFQELEGSVGLTGLHSFLVSDIGT